jgi:hypothetical protein
MLTLLLLLTLLHSLNAQFLNECATADRSAKCPVSFGGFHLFCQAATLNQARQICAQNSLQLAVITDANAAAALQTHQRCVPVPAPAWIDSFNGLTGPCVVQSPEGFASPVLFGGCEERSLFVLCQDIPRSVSTLTSTISKTIYTGIQQVTTTITPSVCPTRHHHHRNLPPKQVLLQEANFVPQERPCSNTCQVPDSRYLRIITEPVPFSMAEAACKRHGWNLADYTSGMYPQVLSLLTQCPLASDTSYGWVRSADGVDGAACIFVLYGNGVSDSVNPELGGRGLSPAFGYSPNFCDNTVGPQYPVCDVRCKPARTGLGPADGTVTSFTAVTRTTVLTSAPLSVQTVTVTQWPRHEPGNTRCCCRSCQKQV